MRWSSVSPVGLGLAAALLQAGSSQAQSQSVQGEPAGATGSFAAVAGGAGAAHPGEPTVSAGAGQSLNGVGAAANTYNNGQYSPNAGASTTFNNGMYTPWSSVTETSTVVSVVSMPSPKVSTSASSSASSSVPSSVPVTTASTSSMSSSSTVASATSSSLSFASVVTTSSTTSSDTPTSSSSSTSSTDSQSLSSSESPSATAAAALSQSSSVNLSMVIPVAVSLGVLALLFALLCLLLWRRRQRKRRALSTRRYGDDDLEKTGMTYGIGSEWADDDDENQQRGNWTSFDKRRSGAEGMMEAGMKRGYDSVEDRDPNEKGWRWGTAALGESTRGPLPRTPQPQWSDSTDLNNMIAQSRTGYHPHESTRMESGLHRAASVIYESLTGRRPNGTGKSSFSNYSKASGDGYWDEHGSWVREGYGREGSQEYRTPGQDGARQALLSAIAETPKRAGHGTSRTPVASPTKAHDGVPRYTLTDNAVPEIRVSGTSIRSPLAQSGYSGYDSPSIYSPSSSYGPSATPLVLSNLRPGQVVNISNRGGAQGVRSNAFYQRDQRDHIFADSTLAPREESPRKAFKMKQHPPAVTRTTPLDRPPSRGVAGPRTGTPVAGARGIHHSESTDSSINDLLHNVLARQ